VLFHCKPVNRQKTSIFALILWEEQRLNRFRSGSLDSQPQVIMFTSCLPRTQGITVIFSHHQVCIKKKKGGHFWGAKSESRVSAPFFAHTQFRFIRTKYQGEFSLVEGFKVAFLREIIYSSCQKIFLKCCLPIFPDWLRQGKI
jgi:hypothetical protein